MLFGRAKVSPCPRGAPSLHFLGMQRAPYLNWSCPARSNVIDGDYRSGTTKMDGVGSISPNRRCTTKNKSNLHAAGFCCGSTKS